MVRIEDVAKHAGVSIATVSRVMNGNYRITTARYNKVLEAIDELGYKVPRKQHENKQKQILIISSLINEEFIYYFEDSAGKYDFSTLYKYIPESEVDINTLQHIDDCDGIIIIDALASEETYGKLRKLCPVVLCRIQYNLPNTISVSVDDEQVAYDVTSHFINKGNRRIAIICDIDRSYNSETSNLIQLADRKRILNGYYLAHIDNNIPIHPELVITSDDYIESHIVEEKFRQLIADPELCPDAVFSASIIHSVKLSDIAKESNLQVQKEIEFATCGALFSNLSLPNMIYAGQPIDRLADVTMQTLNAIIKDELPSDKQHHIYIEHTLVFPG